MMALLRDPLWQFIGAVLAALTILFGYWIYRLQRPRKELAYGVLSRRRLLSVANEVRSRVKVTVDERPVQDLHLIVIGIKNSGHAPAVAADYMYSPTLRVRGDMEIISAEVSTLFPSNLQVSLTFREDRLEFRPPLLNPGDYFTIQVLTSGKNTTFEPDFRLIGTSKIERLRSARPFSTFGDKLMLSFWLVALSFLVFLATRMSTTIEMAVFGVVPVVAVLGILYTWIRSRYTADASRYIDAVEPPLST